MEVPLAWMGRLHPRAPTSDLQGFLPLDPPLNPPIAVLLQPKCVRSDGTDWDALALTGMTAMAASASSSASEARHAAVRGAPGCISLLQEDGGLRGAVVDRRPCAPRFPALQSFCNPNPRSAMGFVGSPWETGPGFSLQIGTVLVTACGQTHLSGPIVQDPRGALSPR